MSHDSSVPTAVSKSVLFTFYNKARAKASGLDRKRCDRAISYIQAGKVVLLGNGSALVRGNGDIYLVDPHHGCECPDALYRSPWCKHRIAWALLTRCAEQEAAEPAPAPAYTDADLEADIALLYG